MESKSIGCTSLPIRYSGGDFSPPPEWRYYENRIATAIRCSPVVAVASAVAVAVVAADIAVEAAEAV